MKVTLGFLLVTVCLIRRSWCSLSSNELDELWLDFMNSFQKSYPDKEEMMYRRSVWEKNIDSITKHNIKHGCGLVTFTLGINKYSDLSFEEYKQTLLGYRPRSKLIAANETKIFAIETNENVPETVDWRTKGYVTPVKDQGDCGSCWAFSTTGVLEGQQFNKTGKLISLSEQNLMDCSAKFGNEGCAGGDPISALQYVQENKGIDTEISYPYDYGERKYYSNGCRYTVANRGATCNGIIVIPKSESALMVAVGKIGPISVSIDASHPSFSNYDSGIYNEKRCSTTDLDHSVLVVGYGTDKGIPYWLVKNSWGDSWGEDGYIRMSRNKNNQCGIATEAVYPLV